MMRKGLVSFFKETGRWSILGQASSLVEAKSLLANPLSSWPDIVLLDIQLDGAWGLELVPWLREQCFIELKLCENSNFQNTKKIPDVVVYSSFTDYSHISAAYKIGVKGYVCKTRSEMELESALNTVLRGELYWDQTLIPKIMMVNDVISRLTKKETEIFMLVQKGLSNKNIAEKLGINQRTVENHLCCIYDKTGISSRSALQKL
jgi:DNA-binding NarL/FixJ family response regulator